tara:strand:- start:54 stop:377 length:324 start_codon:yes stop_codon:yes gene_type:complete
MEMNGRYDHIEDVLTHLYTGQWFGWSDSKNKVYANLVIHNSDYDKPTEKSLTDALLKQQSDFDAQEYARNRATEYPALAEQLDEIYHNGIDSWKAVIKVTKDKYPKG